VYQVKPANSFLNPIQLEEISLKALELNNSAYQNAVSIARSGLWTPAFEWLQLLKTASRKNAGSSASAN
jgi:hypothetical protein